MNRQEHPNTNPESLFCFENHEINEETELYIWPVDNIYNLPSLLDVYNSSLSNKGIHINDLMFVNNNIINPKQTASLELLSSGNKKLYHNKNDQKKLEDTRNTMKNTLYRRYSAPQLNTNNSDPGFYYFSDGKIPKLPEYVKRKGYRKLENNVRKQLILNLYKKYYLKAIIKQYT
ncbi:hypothetical protein BB558_006740 [Smittium angustum]|uniref:Uncharacterized protein n=1 Tax=Smittium angustum TaxID=133377 RepID=A0A2U1IVK8_SMIAN|nr:hypothetical protein BB558_007251 [Smittium angustum]PVZ97312.1 hypothetical protein BB558_006740 [Smittium angustum]